MKVMGLDPGLSAAGLAQIDGRRCLAAKTVRTSPGNSFEHRMFMLSREIAAALIGADLLVIEDQHDVAVAQARAGHAGHGSGRLEQVVGLARGLADARGIPVVLLSPARIRALLGLPSRAKKAAVARAVRDQVAGIKVGVSEHAVDAVAIALAGEREWHARTVIEGTRRSGT